ncbi:arabinose efflux permease [Paenibacillus sp. JCM 10914]|nr:arabinose efflux permease [Paenibacillus sp. JCM 10914]
MIGGKLADWKLLPSILGIYLATAIILTVFTLTMYHPVTAVLTIILWGAASFAVMPGMQVRVMNLAQSAPALASTASHSAGNLGNAAGAFIGGLVITHLSLSSLPWVGAVLVSLAFLLGMACYIYERRAAAVSA